MFDLKAIMEQELRYQQNMKKIYLGKLKGLPEGNLSASVIRGNTYYYNRVNGERIYLGRDNNTEISKMQSHKLLTSCVDRIESNEKLMNEFMDKYQSITPNDVRDTLGKAYQNAEIDFMDFHSRNSKNWGDQEYNRSTKFSEKLVHRTMKGEFVRSKSEVIIANNLYTRGLQYRYEEITKIGSHIFAPDFKILIPRVNKIKFLEHFGMMYDSKYRDHAFWKMSAYIENGYRPYEDVLFTFDDLNGNIDAKNLDILLTSFCK